MPSQASSRTSSTACHSRCNWASLHHRAQKGKLPHRTVSFKYDLEYGSAEIEMHVDVVKPGMRVLVHDDLLATGGTAAATAELVRMQGRQGRRFQLPHRTIGPGRR